MKVVFFLQGRAVPASRARGYSIARALGWTGLLARLGAVAPSRLAS